MTEMKSGKRPSIGRAEMLWATQYEQSLLPPDMRFPRVGEIYEAVADTETQFEIYFSAPVTNSGTGKLLNGERVRITSISPKERPIWAFARPLQYRTVEDRFVEKALRQAPYGHYAVVLKTAQLSTGFRLVRKWSVRNLALAAADAFRRA